MVTNKKIIFALTIVPFILFALFITHRVCNKPLDTPHQELVTEANNVIVPELIPSITVSESNNAVTKLTESMQEQKETEVVAAEAEPSEIQEDNTVVQTIPETQEPQIQEVPVSNEYPKNKKKKLFAYDITKYAYEPELVEALKLLEASGESDVIKNIQKYGFRVKFDDFLNVIYKRELYYGMTAYNQYGSRVILVNSIYRKAPIEQLACIIAHESMHVSKKPDLEEETLATQKEAACWYNLKNDSKEYPNTRLTARLNKLLNYDYYELREKIANTSIYREQF